MQSSVGVNVAIITKPPHLADLKPVMSTIRRTRTRLRLSWMLIGLLLTVGVFLWCTWLMVGLDLAWPMPDGYYRLAAFLLIVATSVWTGFHALLRPMVRRLNDRNMARRIERHLPDSHDRLVSCVDFSAPKKAEHVSPSFLNRLIRESLDILKSFHPSQIVNRENMLKAGLVAGASLLAWMALTVPFYDRIPTTVARLFAPFADIPPATGVVINLAPENAKVARGDSITLTASFAKGTAEELRIKLIEQPNPKSSDRKSNADKVVWQPLAKAENGTFSITLPSLQQGLKYRVYGGRTWTKEQQITLVERPIINRLHHETTYPEYLGSPEPKIGANDDPEIRGPEGSKVELFVQATGDGTTGEIQFVQEEVRKVPKRSDPPRIWFEKDLPGGARSANGAQEIIWHDNIQSRRAHANEFGEGTHTHRFDKAQEGFLVKPGESVFADVYMPQHNPSKELMISFQIQGKGVTRAFWGEDHIAKGKRGESSRRFAGPLPESGSWQRIEIPAKSVDLENRMITGLEFSNFDGEVFWGAFGAINSAQSALERRWVVTGTAPIVPESSPGDRAIDPALGALWKGSFQLTKSGFYRIELKNELGITNTAMAPAKITVQKDLPPIVRLEKPANDITISKAKKIPVQAVAQDDFGLRSIQLSVQLPGESSFRTHGDVASLSKPLFNSSFTSELDLEALELKPNQELQYRIDAVDRKGQIGQTRVYKIRFVQDWNSADQQLDRLLEEQKQIVDQLTKAIEEQNKINDKLASLQKKPAPNESAKKPENNDPNQQKAQDANEQKDQQAAKQGDQSKQANADPNAKTAEKKDAQPAKTDEKLPKLDPNDPRFAEAKQMLEQLANLQNQNADLAKQIAERMANNAKQAQDHPLMPNAASQQIDRLREQLDQETREEMQQLSEKMRANAKSEAKPNQNDAAAHQQEGNEIKNDLEKLRDRMQSLREASKRLTDDPTQAVQDLAQEVQKQTNEQTLQDLLQLKDFAGALGSKMNDLANANPPNQADPSAKNANDPGKPADAKSNEPADAKQAKTADAKSNDKAKEQGKEDPNSLTSQSKQALEQARELLDTPEMGELAKPQSNQPDGDAPDANEANQQGNKPADAKKPQNTPTDDNKGQDSALADLLKKNQYRPSIGGEFAKPRAGEKESSPQAPQAGNQKSSDQPKGTGKSGEAEAKGDGNQAGQPQAQAEAGKKSEGGNDAKANAGKPASALNQATREELAQAESALKQDTKTLGRLAEEMNIRMLDNSPTGMQRQNDLLQSKSMQDAMDMAGRMKEMVQSKDGQEKNQQSKGKSRKPGKTQKKPGEGQEPNRFGAMEGKVVIEGIGELDQKSVKLFLKLPPMVREELLQGAKEAGPEGYQDFIKNYFQKLSRASEQQ